MSKFYHHDENGKLTGYTTDEPPPPQQGAGCLGVVAVIIGVVLVILFLLNSESRKPDNAKTSQENTRQVAESQDAPGKTSKDEPNGRTVITHTVTREESVHGDRLDASPALQDQLRKMEELKRKARARDFDENP